MQRNAKLGRQRFIYAPRARENESMNRILLIDDDVELSKLLSEYLRGEGFEVDAVFDGATAVETLRSGHWDAVILDVMLPGMNGFDILKQVRPGLESPVLMLTARGEDTDTVLGLELGADDYVAKPVSPRVLVARLRALMRRPGQAESHTIEVGDLSLDKASRSVQVSGNPVELTGAEFNLLQCLVEQAGHVVSREILAEQGLGRALQAYDRRIETHMTQIRRKLGPLTGGEQRIQTVRGSGYQYVLR
ncbi:MAG: response regulator transcription factor [Gammaproteobacteria bacterium]|nr:response regulator transcription factor [Gammaproteobacteria bacterium]